MSELEELILLCRFGGAHVLMTQGTCGNASMKSRDGRAMWIKASGCRMDEVGMARGWVKMHLPEPDTLAGIHATPSELLRLHAAANPRAAFRPSMEVWLHLVLDRAVLHTHPVYANTFSCMREGAGTLAEILNRPLACVDYQTPGYLLGKAVECAAAADRKAHGRVARQWLLANHGLISSAPTMSEAIALTEEVLDAGVAYFGPFPAGSLRTSPPPARVAGWAASAEREAHDSTGQRWHVSPAKHEILRANWQDHEFPAPLVPDDVVLNGPGPRRVSTPEEAAALIDQQPSTAFAVEGMGIVFAAATKETTAAMEEQLLANVLVRTLVARKGQIRNLPFDEIDVLQAMEAEKDRQRRAANVAWNAGSWRVPAAALSR